MQHKHKDKDKHKDNMGTCALLPAHLPLLHVRTLLFTAAVAAASVAAAVVAAALLHFSAQMWLGTVHALDLGAVAATCKARARTRVEG
jgi:hypothetical protein